MWHRQNNSMLPPLLQCMRTLISIVIITIGLGKYWILHLLFYNLQNTAVQAQHNDLDIDEFKYVVFILHFLNILDNRSFFKTS